jgi:hypothetical protein
MQRALRRLPARLECGLHRFRVRDGNSLIRLTGQSQDEGRHHLGGDRIGDGEAGQAHARDTNTGQELTTRRALPCTGQPIFHVTQVLRRDTLSSDMSIPR